MIAGRGNELYREWQKGALLNCYWNSDPARPAVPRITIRVTTGVDLLVIARRVIGSFFL